MPPKLNKKDLTKILSKYNLGEFRDSKVFTLGSVQTNVLIKTSKGEFVLRYYTNRSKKSIAFEFNLINYLKKHNFSCPALFKNKDGKYISTYNKNHCVFFEFVEGKHIEKPNQSQKKQLIHKVAEMQNILKNYRPANKEHRWNYGVELCKKLSRKEAKKINTQDAREKLKWFENELVKLELPRSLPKGVCHCDFHFANILFKKGKFQALIDFDDANYTYRIFDLVALINPFLPAFSHNSWKKFKKDGDIIDLKDTKKIVSEYMKCRNLNSSEKRHLFDVYKLSVLIDCIWYFSRGNAKDFFEKRKIDYLNNFGREEFYNKLFL
jgi:homoserine kinase type II